MHAVLVDEDFNRHIVAGLFRRRPELRFERAVNLVAGLSDSELLEAAASRGLVVLTHDARTMPAHAYRRVEEGKPRPGVVVVPQSMSIGAAIDELELLLNAVALEELDGRVWRLPL